jgi:beta-glucosidase
LSRIAFPASFLFGAASAAAQIEGAARADGRGESIWDRFARRPGAIRGGGSPEIAADSSRRFAEDVALARELGLASYRFSIAWPRVLPRGRGQPSQTALDHYGRLVDALLAAGIRPLPTLYHWDLPQALEDRGGWPERDTAFRFADYAHETARALGDRVSDWILLHDPLAFTWLGYAEGLHAPGRSDLDAFWRATHVVNLAQALGAEALRAARGEARVGTALGISLCEPAGDSEADAAAAERWYRFANLWFLEPARSGRYPDAFPDAPPPFERMNVQEEDLKLLRFELDFLGVCARAPTRVRAAPDHALGIGAEPLGGAAGPSTAPDAAASARGLHEVLRRLAREAPDLPLEIAESTCARDGDARADAAAAERRRSDFHRAQLEAVARALAQGCDVRSYHVWSLLDGFEWAEGYTRRCGLVSVDFPSGARTLTPAGRWYARVAAERSIES